MNERPRRTRPLQATRATTSASAAPDNAVTAADASRYRRLAEGVRALRTGAGPLDLGDRTLMVLGGVIAPLGLVIVGIGWYGAAHSPFLFQQVPYLISGLGIGLGFVILGSFLYFAHWLTELLKEGRSQSATMIEAIARLEDALRQQTARERVTDPSPDTDGSRPELVATSKGTMAHRPDCVVVAGKIGLRRVHADEALMSCKLCEPFADSEADAEAASN